MTSRRCRVDLQPNRLSLLLAGRRAAGTGYLDLTVSNPTVVGIPYDAAAITAALGSREALVYEASAFGLPAARETIAELWTARGVPVSASRVALTASTSEAYSMLFKLLCDPGDAVLVPQPSYPLFEHLARYEGIEAVSYPLSYDGSWHIDLAALRRAVTPRTRAVVAVSPNNPTGSFLKDDELRAIGALGLPIISDEVFGEYAFGDDARRARSALEATDGLVFALDGLSKLTALPQMKLAWIATGGPPSAVTAALQSLELLLDTFLSPAAPVQHALPRLLEVGRVSRAAIRARARANNQTMERLLVGSAVTALHAEGGWTRCLRLPAVVPEEELTLGLLERRDVLVQPGFFYDFTEEAVIVVSLLTPEATFEEGVRRLVAYVDEL